MTLQNLFDEVERLPVDEKWQLVRYLLNQLQTNEAITQTENWGNFINRMYGALADDPLERPDQFPLTERDLID